MQNELRLSTERASFDEILGLIGRRLRALYDADIARRVPDRISRLLDQIDGSETRVQDVER